MISSIIHSYPARLLFMVAAIAAAIAIIMCRTLFVRGADLLTANLYTNP